jgi:hypothetical protein
MFSPNPSRKGGPQTVALRDKEHYARLPLHYLFEAIPVRGGGWLGPVAYAREETSPQRALSLPLVVQGGHLRRHR